MLNARGILRAVAVMAGLGLAGQVMALEIQVKIENLAPASSVFLTPMWVGFQDGTFDLYNEGQAASVPLGGNEIESLAEDGNTAPLSATFTANGFSQQATITSDVGIPPIGPGETATATFTLDGADAANRYFSYASMVIPSNDAFIANDNPLAYMIFDAGGNFIGADFVVLGSAVNDAGTELNDETPTNTAFFGQAAPNTGQDENVVVHDHVGFQFPGSGGILDDPQFSAADFTTSGFQLVRITVSAVQPIPEPTSALLLMAMGGLWGMRRRRMMHA